MTYRAASAAIYASAAVMASLAAPSAARAAGGPSLMEKTLYTSDIQYRFTRAPDNKALSIVFDNFSVALPRGSGAPAIRVFPLRIPVTDASTGATLRLKARGRLDCPAGTTCIGILWVNGQTKAISHPRGKKSTGTIVEAEFVLPGADVHQAAVMLIAERATGKRDCTATIRVDALEVAIAPPPADAGAGKK
jgi:hypothetical protein